MLKVYEKIEGVVHILVLIFFSVQQVYLALYFEYESQKED